MEEPHNPGNGRGLWWLAGWGAPHSHLSKGVQSLPQPLLPKPSSCIACLPYTSCWRLPKKDGSVVSGWENWGPHTRGRTAQPGVGSDLLDEQDGGLQLLHRVYTQLSAGEF